MAAGDETAEMFSSRKVCLARAREHLGTRSWRAARATLLRGARQWLDMGQDPEYLTLLGNVAWRQHCLKEARGLLRRASRLPDSHVEARFLLGRVLLDSGRTEEAVRVLNAVAYNESELVPYRVHAGGALSVAYAALGLNKSSQDALEHAASFGLISAQLLADEGFRLMRIGAWPEAEVQLAKGLQVDATCEDAFFRLANVLLIQDKLEPALEVLAYGIEQSAEETRFYELAAEIYEARGQHKESAAFLRRALECSPDADHADAVLMALAAALHHAGRSDGAIAAYRELLGRFPRSEMRETAQTRLASLESRGATDRAARLEGFPRKLQRRAYCAPNTLANVLTYVGRPVTQEEVAARVFRGAGTRWPEVLDYLADLEGIAWRATFGGMDMLRHCVDHGVPVVTTEYHGQSGHALAVTGYDDIGKLVIAQDPRFLQSVEIPYAEFEAAWLHDDGLSIAIAPASRARALPPQDAATEARTRMLLELLRMLGDDRLDEAATAADALAAEAPELQSPRRIRAEIALRKGDFARVITICNAALEKWPRCFWAQRHIGDAHWMQGDAANALVAFHAALQIEGRDPLLAYAMGELLLSVGQRRQGRAWLLKALREDPRMHAARLRMAEDCFAAGDDAAGSLHARLLIEYDPDHAQARELLARKKGATAVRTLAETARRVNESIRARQDAAPTKSRNTYVNVDEDTDVELEDL